MKRTKGQREGYRPYGKIFHGPAHTVDMGLTLLSLLPIGAVSAELEMLKLRLTRTRAAEKVLDDAPKLEMSPPWANQSVLEFITSQTKSKLPSNASSATHSEYAGLDTLATFGAKHRAKSQSIKIVRRPANVTHQSLRTPVVSIPRRSAGKPEVKPNDL
ncbi:hypothetical protein [Cypionkella sp.]|uniref:hypothetical protein n=1 Tax=Cypionkella sp. TaxID=2811411 RepID=UPI00260DE544|nr:hypothetical protein [Cypionkella sp.]